MVLYVAGYTVIGFSSLATALLLFSRRSSPLVLTPAARGLFGVLALLSGMRYAAETLTLFTGIYRLEVWIVAAIAAISAITVLVTGREFLEQSR